MIALQAPSVDNATVIVELLIACQQYHVAGDGAAEVALFKEAVSELIEVGDFAVAFTGELIDGQEALIGTEGEMAAVVVGEVAGAVAVANDIKLHEAEQRLCVAVAGVTLVFDDLLHRSQGIDAKAFDLNLHHRHTVDRQNHVKTMVAVVRIDAELVDDLEVIFASILKVH